MQNNFSPNQIGKYTYLDHLTLRGLSPAGIENRASFAVFVLGNIIVNAILLGILSTLSDNRDAFNTFLIIWIVVNIYLSICSLMAMSRRLHHIGYSGFLCLFALIPYFTGAFILYLIIKPGKDF